MLPSHNLKTTCQSINEFFIWLVDAIDFLPNDVMLWDKNNNLIMANKKAVEKYEDKNFKMVPGASRIKLVENLLSKGLVKTDGKLSPKEFIKERIKGFEKFCIKSLCY